MVIFLLQNLRKLVVNPFAVMIPISLLLSLIVVTPSLADSTQESTIKQLLTGNWFYHWGDLPKDPVTGQWQYKQEKWKSIEFPADIPGQQDEKIVWIKIDLPSGNWRDPYLFVSSVDLTMEVFQENQKLYYFGEIDEQGNSQFEGWPWHIIKLPSDYDQHTLYFRIFSDYPYIGLSGEVAIGNHFNLLNDVYQRGLTGLSLILMVLLVGIISTVMGTIKKDRFVAISTGLLSFDLALMMFSENELSQVVLFAPLLWRYIAAFCYFLIPGFLAIITLAWLKEKSPIVVPAVLVITIGFVSGVVFLSAFTSFNFVNAYPYFDVLFIVLVLALIAGCFKQFNKLGITGRLMTFGILALFVSLMLDMLSAYGFITWLGHAGQWGLILFTLASLMVYLVRDWQQQLALNDLTHKLESKVLDRTAELHESKKQLEKLSREDFLTTLLNRRAFSDLALNEISNSVRHKRPISLVLFDLDHFKDVNDKYGHATGDLVLKAVASTTKNTCREGELICRYGGEEFVILLHATEAEYAQQLVQRLCSAIKEIEVTALIQTTGAAAKTIGVTASFGLICIKDMANYQGKAEHILEQLLAEADRMMYEVKISGRDGIKVSELNSVKPSICA